MQDYLIERNQFWCHLTARTSRILKIQAIAASKGNQTAVLAADAALDFIGKYSLEIFLYGHSFVSAKFHIDRACADVESYFDPLAESRRTAAEAHFQEVSEWMKNPSLPRRDRVDAVAAALIPAEADEAMGIADARKHWELALAEADRAKAALAEAMTRQDEDKSGRHLAQYLIAIRDYSEALGAYADAETDLHMATMTPAEAANLAKELDDADDFEG